MYNSCTVDSSSYSDISKFRTLAYFYKLTMNLKSKHKLKGETISRDPFCGTMVSSSRKDYDESPQWYMSALDLHIKRRHVEKIQQYSSNF